MHELDAWYEGFFQDHAGRHAYEPQADVHLARGPPCDVGVLPQYRQSAGMTQLDYIARRTSSGQYRPTQWREHNDSHGLLYENPTNQEPRDSLI